MLFISGLPRSGTKLLRDLLNNHPEISIPEVETVFIPYLIRKYGVDFDLNNEKNFQLVCNDIESSTFYTNYRIQQGDIQAVKDIAGELNPLNWRFLFEQILAYFGPKAESVKVLGEKTPGYITKTEEILAVWENAKFIHIVRDPRDYVLSVNKAWKRNIYRAAYRWNKSMLNVEANSKLNENNLLTVYFEDLLSDTESVMQKICSFLDIEYDVSMITLSKVSENLGDARGKKSIVADNKQKFLSLRPSTLRKIEGLTAQGMKLHGYDLHSRDINSRSPAKTSLLLYKLADGWHSALFHIREKGLKDGLSYFVKLNKLNA